MKLKKGMRVKGEYGNIVYIGTVYSIEGECSTIKRDDGTEGGGTNIDGYGIGWNVRQKENGTWGADGSNGTLIILGKQKKETWKDYYKRRKR